MEDIVRAVVLGLVQGITEFLPVSSDGHLLLVRSLFGWPDEGLTFDTVLHFGTFLALLVAFRATWGRLLRSIVRADAPADRRLLLLVALATLPAALIGYFAEDLVSTSLRGLPVTAIGFFVSAVLLCVADVSVRRVGTHAQTIPTPMRAFGIGVLQVFALLPGLSRSGATISGGMFAGLAREHAVNFSFLMALPIVGGASLHGLLRWGEQGATHPLALLLGALAAFLSGLWAIRILQTLARRTSFTPLIVYLLFVAALTWILGR